MRKNTRTVPARTQKERPRNQDAVTEEQRRTEKLLKLRTGLKAGDNICGH